MLWTDVVLYDWTHYSGEFGERPYHVRRVRTTTLFGHTVIQGLARVDWFNPDDSGTDYEWTNIGLLSDFKKG